MEQCGRKMALEVPLTLSSSNVEDVEGVAGRLTCRNPTSRGRGGLQNGGNKCWWVQREASYGRWGLLLSQREAFRAGTETDHSMERNRPVRVAIEGSIAVAHCASGGMQKWKGRGEVLPSEPARVRRTLVAEAKARGARTQNPLAKYTRRCKCCTASVRRALLSMASGM